MKPNRKGFGSSTTISLILFILPKSKSFIHFFFLWFCYFAHLCQSTIGWRGGCTKKAGDDPIPTKREHVKKKQTSLLHI